MFNNERTNTIFTVIVMVLVLAYVLYAFTACVEVSQSLGYLSMALPSINPFVKVPSYSSVHDYFEDAPIPYCDTNEIFYDVRLDAACDIIDDVNLVIEHIEDFDVHDLMDILSIHFDVEKCHLLEHYDSL